MRTKDEPAQQRDDTALPPKRPPAPNIERGQGQRIPRSRLN